MVQLNRFPQLVGRPRWPDRQSCGPTFPARPCWGELTVEPKLQRDGKSLAHVLMAVNHYAMSGSLHVRQAHEGTLPILCGPNRCALVHSQDRQPLIELSLRVNLPVVKLLQALVQVAPKTTEPAPARPFLAHQRSHPIHGSGPHDATVRQQERPSPQQHNSDARHSWEPCPSATPAGWDHQQASLAQRDEQMQLFWALTDQTVSPQQSSEVTASRPCACSQRKQAKTMSSPPCSKSHPKAHAAFSKATSTPNKPPPPKTRRTNAEDSDDFDPPARPGAHPKKCPVQ